MEEVLFVYKCLESDYFLDSIPLFLPNSICEEDRMALCSQLIGVYEFCSDLTNSSCDEVTMSDDNMYAFINLESYIMVLSCKDLSAKQILSNLCAMFTLYFCSFSHLFQVVCKKDTHIFRRYLIDIFTSYLQIVRRHGDKISQFFNSVPAISQKKCSQIVYSKIAKLLEKINIDVLGSMITYKNRILISKFETQLSYCLLVNKNTINFPCQRLNPEYELPSSVKLYRVWMSKYFICNKDDIQLDTSNTDSGLDISITMNSNSGNEIKEFLLFTVSCSNIKYSAIMQKENLYKEALMLRLWQILLKSLSEIDILLKNDRILKNEKDELTEDFLLFNELSNELSGHMTITNCKEDTEMFFESINLHTKLNLLGNHSEIEICKDMFSVTSNKTDEESLFVFKKNN